MPASSAIDSTPRPCRGLGGKSRPYIRALSRSFILALRDGRAEPPHCGWYGQHGRRSRDTADEQGSSKTDLGRVGPPKSKVRTPGRAVILGSGVVHLRPALVFCTAATGCTELRSYDPVRLGVRRLVTL